MHFCKFVLTSARNLSRLNQFTYMHLKGLVTHFQKSVLFIILWLTVSEVWAFEVEKFLRNFCWVSIFFVILIANISWTVAQTPIKHNIFWNSVIENFQMHVHKLLQQTLLRLAQNCKKCTFSKNLQTITQEENVETRQVTSK